MNGKLLIPICIFIACQAMYDLFGVIQNTHWSIFYYSAQYFSWLVLVILLMKRKLLTRNNIPYYIISLGLIIYLFFELKEWNTSYIEYYSKVNEFKPCILPISVLITGLTFYIFRK